MDIDEIEVVMPVSLVQKLVGVLSQLDTDDYPDDELFILYVALSDVLEKLEVPPITLGTIDTIGKVNPNLN